MPLSMSWRTREICEYGLQCTIIDMGVLMYSFESLAMILEGLGSLAEDV
jgi:hypothetical protein